MLNLTFITYIKAKFCVFTRTNGYASNDSGSDPDQEETYL